MALVLRHPVYIDPDRLKRLILELIKIEEFSSELTPGVPLQIDPATLKVITRLIKHADLPDVTTPHTTADIEDESITRAKLEYPTVDVALTYLSAIGKFECPIYPDVIKAPFVTVDAFADKAIEARFSLYYLYMFGRFIDPDNSYHVEHNCGYTTSDHYMWKTLAGTETGLAYEAVDLTAAYTYYYRFSCLGTALKSFRDDFVTPRLSVTDTDIASGKWGYKLRGDWTRGGKLFETYLRAPASPAPRVLKFFEAPVVGKGTMEDPFRVKMPQELADHPTLGKINRLALSHSSLIKCGRDGKPKEYVAVVRVFEQPDRQAHLKPIAEAIDALKAMRGVRELSREDAIRRAKQLDDLLTDWDFGPVKPTGTKVREYRDWRRSAFKVETEERDAKEFLKGEKGW